MQITHVKSWIHPCNELINSAETAKRLLRIEHVGMSSPKEVGEKSTSSSEEVISSQTSVAFAGDLNFVRNSERPQGGS